MLVAKVREVRCAPESHPCPKCGKRGRRKRVLFRRIRSLAFRQVAYTNVHYAEYKARCGCCKYFYSWPLDVPAKAKYDDLVRNTLLERILDDGLNVQRALASMKRDFFLGLSEGFVYNCLRWKVSQLELPPHRQMVRDNFSGTLCVDEIHLGRYVLLLATDPLSDLPVAFALVSRNDSAHMRRFLLNLKNWGLTPEVVVTDGSNLYPAVVAELWPSARHQLCIFHILKDINDLVLKGVRRLGRALGRRGKAGRKGRRGRRSKAQRQAQEAARRRNGPTLVEKSRYVMRHRFLIVKKTSELSTAEWQILLRMFEYEPRLQTLWHFAGEARGLFEEGARVQTLGKRRAALLRNESYQGVPELVKAMKMLEQGKFKKMVAFASSQAGKKVRTNNHVERANRKLRFAEKARYKWRRKKWVIRFVLLALDRAWRDAAARLAQRHTTPDRPPAPPPQAA